MAPINPPMITIAKGRWLSDPIPWLKAAGSRPIAAMEAVINTERTLDFTLILIESSRGCLSRRLFLMSDIMITPFCIQIPKRAIKPIPAEIEKLKFVINRAKIPPTAA